jgi:gliding motility-associated-like protein
MRRICTDITGKITINWYTFKDTCQEFKEVLIYGRPDQFSSYVLIDSVTDYNVNSYVFAKGVNYLSGSFYIEYITRCGKTILSRSDTLEVDTKPHSPMDPDSISVLSNGSVIIGWSLAQNDSFKDTKSFIIYSVKGGDFPIDTIYRTGNLFGVDKKADANSSSKSYSIAPVDSCDNVAPIGNIHSTIFLDASQDSCKYSVTLSWSSYVGWSARNYEVYYSEDSSKGYKYWGSATGNNITLYGLKNLKRYYFFVRAVKDGPKRITSSSNRISLITSFERDFKYIYIKTVSVINSGLSVSWTTSNNAEVGYFELYRGLNEGSMKVIATIPGTVLNNGEFNYVDTEIDPSTNVWYYKVKTFNTCGHFSGWSNIPHNILLRLVKNGRRKYLSWNAYDTWSGGVMLYNIYRQQESTPPSLVSIGQESSTGLNFTDYDSFSSYTRPGICYYVKALEGDSNKYGFTAESYSNKVCYIDAPVVYIPNAFVPDQGVNKIFKPITTYADLNNSTMTVYNRWGEIIFKSNDIETGWDGKLSDGTFAPTGVYLYDLRIYGLDNTSHTYRGTFTLL